jgi:PAS domain S-box-containing protein
VFFDITERRRAEEALRESEAQFASFMRHIPGTAVMRDFEGRYLFANEAWERLQHRTRQDWEGKTIAEVWPPHMATKFYESDLKVIAQGETVQTMKRFPKRTASTTGWSINSPSRTKTAGRS